MTEQTILIVDDSMVSRMLIKQFTMEAQPHWRIIEAKDGEDALKKCEGQDITYMTVDYNMPGIDGLTLCIKLKELFPKAAISLLTANIQDSVKARADQLGIVFIQKPVTESKIKAFVES